MLLHKYSLLHAYFFIRHYTILKIYSYLIVIYCSNLSYQLWHIFLEFVNQMCIEIHWKHAFQILMKCTSKLFLEVCIYMNELRFSVSVVAYNFSRTCVVYLPVLDVLHPIGLVNLHAAV